MEATNGINHKIISALKNLEKMEGPFSGLTGAYRELLHIQMEAKRTATVVELSPDKARVRDRFREGIPLLLFEDFHPDWNQVQAVSKQIIAWAAADADGSRETQEELKKIGSTPERLRAAAELWYRGHSFKAFAQVLDIELLASVVGATLKPFLSVYSELLAFRVEQESWRRNYCPVCGGAPDFSSLKEGGARWLFCHRCDGEWLFSRIECPYCGTRNQESLAYFSSDEQASLYRLYVCEECHTYIKGIDSRVGGGEVLLPLERVCTLNLDREGQRKGYEPGWTTRRCYDGFSQEPDAEEKERRAN